MTAMTQAEIDNIKLDLHLCHTPAQKAAWAEKHGENLCRAVLQLAIEVGDLHDNTADCSGHVDEIKRGAELGKEIRERVRDVSSVFNELEDVIKSEALPYKILQRLDELAQDVESLEP